MNVKAIDDSLCAATMSVWRQTEDSKSTTHRRDCLFLGPSQDLIQSTQSQEKMATTTTRGAPFTTPNRRGNKIFDENTPLHPLKGSWSCERNNRWTDLTTSHDRKEDDDKQKATGVGRHFQSTRRADNDNLSDKENILNSSK